MSETKRAICVGEATVELARGADGRFALASGGDAFNTAVYLARAGQPTAFAGALGDDPYSDAIVSLAQADGVATDLILRVPGRLPALALVDADAQGHRRVHSWREAAPARELVRTAELEPRGGRPARRAAHLFLRRHAVALFQCRARPLSGGGRAGARQRRQDRLRRQFPPARLEGRSDAHAHRVRGSAQARRHRAAGL